MPQGCAHMAQLHLTRLWVLGKAFLPEWAGIIRAFAIYEFEYEPGWVQKVPWTGGVTCSGKVPDDNSAILLVCTRHDEICVSMIITQYALSGPSPLEPQRVFVDEYYKKCASATAITGGASWPLCLCRYQQLHLWQSVCIGVLGMFPKTSDYWRQLCANATQL